MEPFLKSSFQPYINGNMRRKSMYSQSFKSAGSILSLACLVFLPMGCKKAPPITLSCNASAPTVYPGDPLSVTATAGSVDPKKNTNVIYSWSGDGATGNGTSATVNTTAMAPGSYTAKADVKEGKKGKEGLKPGQTAECSASYTVKQFEPPTISCSTSPATIKPGDTATVTSVGMSPQNRPLTYNYTATAGTVTGTGTTAAYSSAGAPTGAVGITCGVSDDKNQMASANTTVTILAPPPPPPPPHTQALCTISFATDKKRPMRVDNEAKACLDQVALDLKQQADAKAVMVGEADGGRERQDRQGAEVPGQAQARHGGPVCCAARGERQGLPGDGAGHRCFAHQRGDWADDGRADAGELPGARGRDVQHRREQHDAGGRDGSEAAGAQAAGASVTSRRRPRSRSRGRL